MKFQNHSSSECLHNRIEDFFIRTEVLRHSLDVVHTILRNWEVCKITMFYWFECSYSSLAKFATTSASKTQKSYQV